MKRLSVLIAMGAIALTAGGASAETQARRRTHLAKTPQEIVNSYGSARPAQRAVPQAKPYDRLEHPYESDSLGHQWFPNPDRVFMSGQNPS